MGKNINDIFKENLNYYMQLKGRTQKELAEYLNISTAMANYYSTGRNTPRMDKVDKICKFLNIERSNLLEQRTSPQTIDDLNLTGIERIAASHKDEDFSQEDLEDIQKYINFVKAKRKNNE